MAWNMSSQLFICRIFFSTSHWKMLSTISAFRKKAGLCFVKLNGSNLTPKISHFLVLALGLIKNSLRFWYYASCSTCCQNLEKKTLRVTGKNWEKAGVKLLRDLTEKSVNLSTLTTSNIRLLLFFGEEDQQMEISPTGEKKFMVTEEKLGKISTFWRNDLPSWAQILSDDQRWS